MKRLAKALGNAAVLLLLAACGTQEADLTEVSSELMGTNEVPPVSTSAGGNVTATLRGDELTVEGDFEGLEGELLEVQGTPAHVHQAPPGATGDIVFPLEVDAGADGRSGSFRLVETLTEQQQADFEAGLYYVNVHTTVHPSGELRAQLSEAEPQQLGDLTTVAGGVTDLTAVAALLEDYGVLNGSEPSEGSFTILAPNNSAVAASVGTLPSHEAALTQILLHHVLPGAVSYSELAALDTVTALSGQTIDISVDAEGNIALDGAVAITKRNIAASNGLIHVIDGVLSPYDLLVEVALSGDAEVPPVSTEASGTATVALSGNTLQVFGSYEGMNATVAHVHGPAAPGANADAVIPLIVDDDAKTFVGQAELEAGQLADLQAGLYYVNVHSEAFPAGEIRGQITVPAE